MPRRPTVCVGKGCPVFTTSTRCPDCAREYEQARGSRQARGYGAAHTATRARLLHHLMPGTPCARCGLGMWAEQELDAGHSVDLRINPDAQADRLEHSACNRAWRKGVTMSTVMDDGHGVS